MTVTEPSAVVGRRPKVDADARRMYACACKVRACAPTWAASGKELNVDDVVTVRRLADALDGPSASQRLRLVAGWAALQVLWLASLAILPATIRRDIPEAWLYPAAADLLIAVSGPMLAVFLVRRPRPATWLAAVVWFAVSAFIRINELALILKVDAPSHFLAGNSTLAGIVVVAVLIGHLIALAVVCGASVRRLFVGEVGSGVQLGHAPRIVAVALGVWAVLQLGRVIAIGVIGDVLNDTANPAWLAPAIGDLIVAAPSLLLAWALWRRGAAWVWVASVVYLSVSIVDHAGTITGDVRVPAPPTFVEMGEMPFPTWFAPLSQGLIDALFVALLLWPVVRRSYFVLGGEPS